MVLKSNIRFTFYFCFSAEMDLTEMNANALFGEADDISSDDEGDKDTRPGPQAGSGDEDTVRRVNFPWSLFIENCRYLLT